MIRRAHAIGLGILLAALAGCSPGRPGDADAMGAGRYQAEQLVGASDDALLQAFGPPAQRRSEPPAEVWQYRSTGCVVDFYLYHQREGGSQRPLGLSVVHLEARSPASRRLPVDNCLTGL